MVRVCWSNRKPPKLMMGPIVRRRKTHHVTWVTERQEPTSPEKLISDVSQLA